MAMKYFAIFCLIGLSLAFPKPNYEVMVKVIFVIEKTKKEIQNISQMKHYFNHLKPPAYTTGMPVTATASTPTLTATASSPIMASTPATASTPL